MAGVLEFTLGLQASEFLSGLGLAQGHILSLAGAGEMLHKAFEKVFQAFEQGAALEHLSRRTGETVGNFYRLQQGLQAAGASAESLPSMLFMMQKSLGGVSEMGESTADVFHKLGLNISELKRLGPAEAFGKIMERMGTMSQESAVKASSMIFGRMGAGTAVQVSRSSSEFGQEFKDAARQAEIFERAGAAFAKIQRTILNIKDEIAGFWAGIAEGAAPAVQTVLDWLRKIDLTSIGTRIGKVLGAITEAIASGEGTALLKESFEAAFEQIGNYAMRMFNGVFAVLVTRITQVAAEMPKIFGVIAPGITAALTGSIKTFAGEMLLTLSNAAQALGQNKLAMTLARSGADVAASSSRGSDEAAAKAKSGLNEILMGTVADMGELGSAFKGAWNDTGSPFGTDSTAKLQAHLGKLMARVGTAGSSEGARASDEDVNFGKGLTHRTEGNAFEKMGFVMGGGGGPIQDVVKNTARTADAIDQLREVIEYNNSHGLDRVQPGMDHAVL
jgi:hypothetical protein